VAVIASEAAPVKCVANGASICELDAPDCSRAMEIIILTRILTLVFLSEKPSELL
jgi:hypothetical protein